MEKNGSLEDVFAENNRILLEITQVLSEIQGFEGNQSKKSYRNCKAPKSQTVNSSFQVSSFFFCGHILCFLIFSVHLISYPTHYRTMYSAYSLFPLFHYLSSVWFDLSLEHLPPLNFAHFNSNTHNSAIPRSWGDLFPHKILT